MFRASKTVAVLAHLVMHIKSRKSGRQIRFADPPELRIIGAEFSPLGLDQSLQNKKLTRIRTDRTQGDLAQSEGNDRCDRGC